MNEKDLKLIEKLKFKAIKWQKYDLAAYLRDAQKALMAELNKEKHYSKQK